MFGWYASGIILLPAILLSLYASSQVKSTFNKYSKVNNRNGYTGSEIARRILDMNNLEEVQVVHVKGKLSDHYDPKSRCVRLSDSVYDKTSIAAVSVAAHECGHALQHHFEYVPLNIRHMIVPTVNIVNQLSMPMIMLGALLGGMNAGSGIGSLMIQLGILFFTGVVFFQFVTLPVEFNASKRALDVLLEERFLTDEEMIPARRVLRAAALTYIAAAAVALLNLIRLIMVFGGGRDD